MKLNILAPLILQKLIWIPTRLVLIIFGSLKVRGIENLKWVSTPAIFACNHSSELDPFMTAASLPFWSRFSPLLFIVREKSFYKNNGWRQHLFNGWFINLWGGYGAMTGLRDYEKSLSQHISLLRDGDNFCVFPEGGITKDGDIQEAKGGISFLAHSAKCTIIPVAISGAFGLAPRDFFLRKGKIIIHFGKPILPEELYSNIPQPHTPGESVWKEEADYIMKKVGELIEK